MTFALKPSWLRNRRLRIVLSAVLIGVICGVLKIGYPVEDLFSGARSSMKLRDAPQDIVIVALDDRTLKELGADDAPRSADARLIENLLGAGVERIFFDRSYQFEEDEAEDNRLVEALASHPGKVFFGAFHADDDGLDAPLSVMPAEKFRDHVGIVSLKGFTHPFRLSVSFPYESETEIGDVPSMSAELAGVKSASDDMFRPDYSIDVKTVPTVSYIDVLEGRADPDLLRGTQAVISVSTSASQDHHEMPFQGYVLGAYFHVVAAHTLKDGAPINLGWIPIFVPVCLLLITGIRRGRSFDAIRISGLTLLIVVAPFVLDLFATEVHVFPSIIAAVVAGLRGRMLDRYEEAGEFNIASGLPSVQMARASKEEVEGGVVALKIRNYEAIASSFDRPVESEFAEEIVRRIHIGDHDAKVYHEGDTFVWVTSQGNPLDIVEHLEGLHRLVQNGIRIDGTEVDLSFNCGVEIDKDRPLGRRASSAMQSAEQAVRSDELVCVHEDSRNDVHWEISVLSSLERAIDNGEVWVAYQPKVDLESDAIVSAEALVRWTHPERGPISPEQFIGIAEEYHRIDKLTRFVLDRAASDAATICRLRPDFSVSVNISAQLLRNPGLPRMIMNATEAHNLPAANMTLEITETDRLDKSTGTIAMMKQLVESGFKLSIDDFGTGNATIDYLRYLPRTRSEDRQGICQRHGNKQG